MTLDVEVLSKYGSDGEKNKFDKDNKAKHQKYCVKKKKMGLVAAWKPKLRSPFVDGLRPREEYAMLNWSKS